MSDIEWIKYYGNKKRAVLCPEGFVVRMFVSSRPKPFIRNNPSYDGKLLLDLSCGYGRNIPFLSALGFKVFGTEISDVLVDNVKGRFPDLSFFVGHANFMPFDSFKFDFVLACNSCYYLKSGYTFESNLTEIERVLKPHGVFVGSVLGVEHSLFTASEKLSDGSHLIKSDQEKIRNGDRVQGGSANCEEVENLLSPFFENVQIGHQVDNCFGFCRDIYYFTAEKR